MNRRQKPAPAEVINPREVDSVAQHLYTDQGLASRKVEFARKVVRAQGIVDEFASAHGWQAHCLTPFFTAVEVFWDQARLWKRLIEAAALPENAPLPSDGLSAALEAGRLFAVTPEAYRALRPEYSGQSDAWERLLAHEMIHQLHLRLVGGESSKMGPQWLYEAFAILGAGQILAGASASKDLDAAWEDTQATGRGSYARYARALDFFLRKSSLHEMVGRAGRPDFERWLVEISRIP